MFVLLQVKIASYIKPTQWYRMHLVTMSWQESHAVGLYLVLLYYVPRNIANACGT